MASKEVETKKKKLHPTVAKALKKVPESLTDTMQFVPEHRRLSRLGRALNTPGLTRKQQLSIIALETQLARLEIEDQRWRNRSILNEEFTI